jgi:hypothetical protein
MGDSKIVTPPPGPKARKLIERELKLLHQPSIDRVYPIFTKKIEGAVVEDVDGNPLSRFRHRFGQHVSRRCSWAAGQDDN